MAASTVEFVQDKAMSYWPTPPGVADELVYQALTPGMGDGSAGGGVPRVRVLEPSAGEGHLARVVREYLPGAHITAVEPSPVRAAALRGMPDVVDVVVEAPFEDYLGAVAWSSMGADWEPFDLVVMNPPFSLAGRPEVWAEHLLSVLQDPALLAVGGMVAAIVPPTLVTGKSKVVRAVQDVLGSLVGRYPDGEVVYERGRVQRCDRGAFTAGVGAGVRPVMAWVEKRSV